MKSPSSTNLGTYGHNENKSHLASCDIELCRQMTYTLRYNICSADYAPQRSLKYPAAKLWQTQYGRLTARDNCFRLEDNLLVDLIKLRLLMWQLGVA